MLQARISRAMHGRVAPVLNPNYASRRTATCCAKEAPQLEATPPSAEGGNGSRLTPPKPPGNNGPLFTPKRLVKLVERKLSNLQLAIVELAVLAALSGVGTVIEQEQTFDWYVNNFPDGPRKVLGFLDYNWIYALQLDHIYTSYYFLGISALLTASLIACSKSRQLPLVKVAKRWSFPEREEQVFAKGNGETLPNASIRDLGGLLKENGYEVFLKSGSLYGFKGISGRFAPIGVHIALVLILFGAALGALGGLEGQVMVPEGGEFLVANRLRGGFTTVPGLLLPEGARKVVRLDSFAIDYRADGSVGQYRSVLTESDLQGRPEKQKEIYVNEPMRFGGITIYQTDWAIAAMNFRVAPDGSDAADTAPQQVALSEVGSKLGMNSSSKLYGTFIPLEVTDGTRVPRGISVLARDLQQVVFYDTKGQFVGVRRPGSGKPITVSGVTFVVDGLVGASGVQLKHDPGIAYVYTGFGFLMITSLISYISHSQVWALQDGVDMHVGGTTNRATVMFMQEFATILDAVPERPSAAAAAAAAAGAAAVAPARRDAASGSLGADDA
eukprot:jgi/Ulvmu1/6464/UM003_0095.1